MDPEKSAIVGHTNKHTTSAHQEHNGGGEWSLAPFMGVVRGDGDSWPE